MVSVVGLGLREHVRAVVGECRRLDEVVGAYRGIEGADGPRRDVGEPSLALEQVILVAVTKVPRDRRIEGNAVPSLLVNHTAVRYGDGQRFDRDPPLRMLGQL